MDPDSWPIIQLLISMAVSALCFLTAGVILEQSTQSDFQSSVIGIPPRFFSALLLGFVSTAFSAFYISEVFLSLTSLLTEPLKSRAAAIAASCAVLALYVYLLIGFCMLAAFSAGRAHNERLFAKLGFMQIVLTPVALLSRFLALPAKKLLSKRGGAQKLAEVTEEDVLELVDTVEGLDVIDRSQKEMIGNIFELADVNVGDIMTHRTELEAVPATADVDDILSIAIEYGYSRIPVYEGSLDKICGVAYVKDLLPYVGKGITDINLRDLIRPTLFVPETYPARALLVDFKKLKIQLAVVVDEYGGTAGVVSMEDILESIVGDIEDEYDGDDSGLVVRNEDGSLTCSGYANIDDVFDLLGLEAPEELDYDTIGGLLTELLTRIPKKGEHPAAHLAGLELTALDTDERRITSVRAALAKPQIEAEKE
ncbi:MAG: hemolysin family protein [Oscillospiraceae bacterium]